MGDDVNDVNTLNRGAPLVPLQLQVAPLHLPDEEGLLCTCVCERVCVCCFGLISLPFLAAVETTVTSDPANTQICSWED